MSEDLVRSDHEIQKRTVKAMFHQRYGIRDSITKPYPKNILVDVAALKQLNKAIEDKLLIHPHEGFLVSVSLKYSNRKIVEFQSWQDFVDYDWFENSAVDSLVINWSFNAKFYQDIDAQPHVLTVKLSNGLRPEELFNILFSSDFSNINNLETNFFPVVAKSTFTDRTFGNELINIVGTWVETQNCKVKNRNKWMLKFQKNKRLLADISKYTSYTLMFLSIGVIGITTLNNLIPKELKNLGKEGLINISILILFLFFLAKTATWFSNYFGRATFDLLREYGDSYIFNLSSTDEKRQNKMLKQERYDKIKLGMNFIFAILINLGYFIFENVLQWLLK